MKYVLAQVLSDVLFDHFIKSIEVAECKRFPAKRVSYYLRETSTKTTKTLNMPHFRP